MAGALSPVGVQSWCDRACVNLIFSYLCEPVLFSSFEAGGDLCDGDCREQNQTFSVSVHASRGMFSNNTVKTYLCF